MSIKEEYTAIDMATAAADGFRDGQRAAQSAPAGEREACSECNGLGFGPFGGCGECCGSGQSFAAQQRTQSAWVPEGYALVPVDPTPKMLVAYMEADGAIKRWKAMIAAAQAQPAAQDQGEVQRLREALESIANCREGYLSGAACTRIARAALAASTGQEVKP